MSKRFPQVYKNKEGSLAVVYSDHVEYYTLFSKDNKPQGSDFEEFNPYYEINTCLKMNGYRHVNGKDEEVL